MKTQNRTSRYLLIFGLMVAGCLSIFAPAQAGETPTDNSEAIRQLLAQVKTEAVVLDKDSDQLAVWAGNRQVQWQSHAEKLNVIREHINNAGQFLAQLNDARDKASPWQLRAIDRIHPLLKELAENTEATINHLNDNRSNIHFPTYRDYAKAGANLADELAALVSDYVEFGEHEAEFHRLQDKLEPTVS